MIEIEMGITANEILDGFIKYMKMKSYHIKNMTEEQRFEMIVDLQSLFYIYVNMFEDSDLDSEEDNNNDNIFIKCIENRKHELFGKIGKSAEWQNIFRRIYYEYIKDKDYENMCKFNS